MQNTANPWRAWRETIQGLTMNEVARRAGISSGRLSIIERGVVPTTEEAAKLRAVLIEASAPTSVDLGPIPMTNDIRGEGHGRHTHQRPGWIGPREDKP